MYKGNLALVHNTFERIPNPMAIEVNLIGDFAGFEIWKIPVKGSNSNKGNIAFRYTSFGRHHVGNDASGIILRMVMYKTPFTSASEFKNWVRTQVIGN